MRNPDPVYFVFSGEIDLEAPVTRAWPVVVNYPSWQNFPVSEHVSGQVGGEGEVVRLKKEEAGYSSPPYYARTIRIEPERRIIWKVYRGPAPGDEGYFGFVDFQLIPDGGRTIFRYNNTYEFQVAFPSQAEVEAFRVARTQTSERVFATIFGKLKSLVEAGAGSA